MIISIIAGMDKNRLIGQGNRLPWTLPADMKHFRRHTLGKPVLMGRKTFESIGKPLPKRTNIILTHDHDYRAVGCIVTHSIEEVLDTVRNCEETHGDRRCLDLQTIFAPCQSPLFDTHPRLFSRRCLFPGI